MKNVFANITDELHFSSLLDELGRNHEYSDDDLASAYLAGQIALIQRFKKEAHGLFNGEKLVGVIDDNDLERYLMEKVHEYKRQAINREIVQTLAIMVETYPDLRFSQILANFGFVKDVQVKDNQSGIITHTIWSDEYNTEPEIVLNRVNNAMEQLMKEIK